MQASEKKSYDLTTGSILSKLLLVAVPIMGTQLMQMTYNLTDMFWLGRVGKDAVAASGSAGFYLWLVMGPQLIGRMGAEIGVAQSLGHGKEEHARRYSQNALFLSVLLGIVIGAAMVVFRHQMISVFAIREAHVASDAALYLGITGAAIPMTYITAALGGTFTGSGNSRIPFYINVTGLVINMLLDPLLIIWAQMGIAGAALATAIGQAVVCILFLIAIKKSKERPFKQYAFFQKPDTPMTRDIFHWSLPAAIEASLFCMLSMVISRFVAGWGADAIAVQRVGSQVESLSWLIAGGFASAITAFVGQNFGAAKWGRIRRGLRLSTIFISGWGIFVSIVLITCGGYFYAIFLPNDPDLIVMGSHYTLILGLVSLPAAVEGLVSGVFRGIGKTLPPSVINITSNTVRIFVAWGLSQTALGVNGLWCGIAFGILMRGIWGFIWYQVMMRRQPQEDATPPREGSTVAP